MLLLKILQVSICLRYWAWKSESDMKNSFLLFLIMEPFNYIYHNFFWSPFILFFSIKSIVLVFCFQSPFHQRLVFFSLSPPLILVIDVFVVPIISLSYYHHTIDSPSHHFILNYLLQLSILHKWLVNVCYVANLSSLKAILKVLCYFQCFLSLLVIKCNFLVLIIVPLGS